jgi:hypothetical protein
MSVHAPASDGVPLAVRDARCCSAVNSIAQCKLALTDGGLLRPPIDVVNHAGLSVNEGVGTGVGYQRRPCGDRLTWLVARYVWRAFTVLRRSSEAARVKKAGILHTAGGWLDRTEDDVQVCRVSEIAPKVAEAVRARTEARSINTHWLTKHRTHSCKVMGPD